MALNMSMPIETITTVGISGTGGGGFSENGVRTTISAIVISPVTQYLRKKMSVLIAHSFTNSVLDNNRCG
jgi:hypothetical protein